MLSTVIGGLHLLVVALIGAGLSQVIATVFSNRADNDLTLAARVARETPFPLWHERNGQIIWTNPAFRALQEADPAFPGTAPRIQVDGHWHLVDRSRGTGHALPIDPLVRAEAELGQMVQTMAKTFAHLPIGLAVFDRDRHLQSFNPALADLIALSPEFLSRRPSLVAVLDAMRNRRMVPEPANWKDWRRSIVEMELASDAQPYEQVWSLSGGQTYRVTGRAQPDGALALMIEDISSETIRNSRHRADLDLCQEVIDALDEAIAVFSTSGRLVMSNVAYNRLWSHQPGSDLGTQGIRHVTAHWRAATAPSQIWAEAEEYVATLGPRDPWRAEARLSDGRLISCRFAPLRNGATLAGFVILPQRSTPRAISGKA